MLGASKSISGFDPRSVGGCSLWLDGADTSSMTFSSGSNISTWADKSGRGANASLGGATSPVFTANAFSGRSAPVFDNSVMQTSATQLSSDNTMSAFVVMRSTTPAQSYNMDFIYPITNFAIFSLYLYPSGESLALTYNSSGPGTFLTPVTGRPILISVVSDAVTLDIYVNGTVVQSRSLGTITTPPNVSTGWWVGQNTYRGALCEILMYGSKMSVSQRQSVEGYLAWKWGLETYVPSSVLQTISGLKLWFDAADPAATGGGSTVSTWTDKSGLGSNATANSAITLVNNGIGGLPALSFNPSTPQWLLGDTSITGQALTVFSVFNATTSYNGAFRIIGLAARDANDYNSSEYVGILQQSSGLGPYRGGTFAYGTFAYGTNSINTSIIDGRMSYAYTNGSLTGTADSGYTNNLAISAYALAMNTNLYDAQYFTGYIGEIIVYSNVLTTTQRQAVESYLAKKWSILIPTQALPLTHPFYYIQPLARYFNPVDIPGCTIWLDGADLSTFTFSSGSNIASWRDKASGLLASNATVSNQPSFVPSSQNGNGTVFFDAAAGLKRLDLPAFSFGTTTRSAFFVMKNIASANYNGSVLGGYPHFFWDRANGNNTNAWTPVGWVQLRVADASGNLGFYTYYLPLNEYIIYEIVYSSSTITTYQTGTLIQTIATISAMYDANNGYSLGGLNNGDDSAPYPYRLYGNIAEVILFNTALNTGQRQQIEGYLAHKWGLRSSIPATHSFKTIPPSTVLPFSPTSISGCGIWLDASDSSTVILSGSSVTQLKDKSGNGRSLPAVSGFANATVSSAYQNGLNVLNFSGNALYRSSAGVVFYPQDVYIVVALKSLTAHVDVLGMGDTASDNFNSLTFSESAVSRWHNGSSGGARQTISTSDETSLSFLLIQWSIANGNYLLRRNGVLLVQASRSYSFNAPSTSVFQIGYRHTNNNGVNFNGYIGEIVVFNRQLGDADRQQVEGYLGWKWGLNTALTSTHPYSRFPPGNTTGAAPVVYSNFMWTRFYNIVSDPSINGPGSSGWGSLIGTAGAYNPINYQDGDGRIGQSDYVGVISKGFVYSATATVITFYTVSDDGVVLYFNGNAVIQNWTYHGDTANFSASVALPAGYTPIELRFFEWGGGFTCELYFSVGSTGVYTSDGTGIVFYNSTSQS